MAITIVGVVTNNVSSGTTRTLTKPVGTADGDLLLAFHSNGWDTYSLMTAPAGWALTTGQDHGSNAQHMKFFTKTAASEGASWVFGSNNDSTTITIIVLRGADNTAANWIYAAPSWTAGTSATRTCPSVTGAAAGAMLLCCATGEVGGGTSTPPSGMSEQSDVISGGSQIQSVATLLSPGSPTGTKAFVFSTNTAAAGGTEFSIVIPEAGGGGAATSLPVPPRRYGHLLQL